VIALIVSQLAACAIAVALGTPLGLGLWGLMEGGDLPEVNLSATSLVLLAATVPVVFTGHRQYSRQAAGQATGRTAARLRIGTSPRVIRKHALSRQQKDLGPLDPRPGAWRAAVAG
jgi:hypothetical protein